MLRAPRGAADEFPSAAPCFVLLLVCPILALVLLSPPGAAQDDPDGDKEGMEEFEETDPYTRGEDERMEAVGYVGFGPFGWHGTDTTTDVRLVLGDSPVLWVETEHFRIGSTLVTYPYSGDREERSKLEDELDRLEDRMGRIKPPKKELDPWLRLHLFAQRAEEQYAAFLEDFGLEEADVAEKGPYLGWPQKFRLLLCERQSEYQRFVRHYLGGESESAWRYFDDRSAMGYAVNLEFLRRIYRQPEDPNADKKVVPIDAVLQASVASGLGILFVEGLRQNVLDAPLWLSRAYGHRCVRRIDPRWVTDFGLAEHRTVDEEHYLWEPRVRNLCKIEYFAPAREMFAWDDHAALGVREHMTAWSRLDYMLDGLDGDDRGFVLDLCRFNRSGGPRGTPEERVELQVQALEAHYGVTPEELDEGWRAWVKKNYDRG